MMNADRYFARKTYSKALRILVITPVDPVDGQEGPFPLHENDRRLLLPTTQVDEILCKGAPTPIYGADSIRAVMPRILTHSQWAERVGYDAILVNCMLDPGVREVQPKLRIPIIGAGRATEALALVLGDRPARIYPAGIPVDQLAADEQYTLRRLKDHSERRVRYHGADVITFACSYLNGAAQQLQAQIGVPVISTIDAALRITELIAVLGILPRRDTVTGRSEPRARKRFLHGSLTRLRWIFSSITNSQ